MLSRARSLVTHGSAARVFSSLTHIDASGKAVMVDVSSKPSSSRFAVASAIVNLGEDAFKQIIDNANKKGDVLAIARVAGIMGAKKTADLIPLCHPVALSKASVDFKLDETTFSIKVIASAKTTGQTGVEMEALSAASVASLTIYDMCKAVSKSITISNIQLEQKTGGKSGDFIRKD